MKKFIFLAVILFFPFTVHALAKEEMLQNEYIRILEIEKPEGYYCFQGFIITDKYFVFATVTKDFSKTKLLIYDIKTMEPVEIEGIEDYNFGHANDMAYNPKTNEIYIVNEKTIHVVDGSTFQEKEPIIMQEPVSSIAYIPGTDEFYFRYMFKGYKYNSKFEKQMEFSMPTNLTRQSFSIYDNYLYYSCYEYGVANANQSIYDGILEAGANLIYVYDLEGNLRTGIYLPAGYGEIEAMEFDNSGIPYLLFNSPDNEGNAILYTPQYYSYSETFAVKDDTSDLSATAELSDEYGVIETVTLSDGTYDFKPISFYEPGVYKYTITKVSESNDDALARDLPEDKINVEVAVEYDALLNTLSAIVDYEQDGFKSGNIDSEIDSEQDKPDDSITSSIVPIPPVNDSKDSGSSGSYAPSGSIENPQTGIFLPLYGIPVGLGVVTGIFLYKKNKIFKI
ncbi:MAG: hypothetical protein K2J20_02130 [Bacilli bacterium]|nr:hypothetical protein [Bacilli bacterium]